MTLTILQSIVAWALVIAFSYIGAKIYETIVKELGVVNVFDEAREVLGGYILAYVLWYERGMDYGA